MLHIIFVLKGFYYSLPFLFGKCENLFDCYALFFFRWLLNYPWRGVLATVSEELLKVAVFVFQKKIFFKKR